MGNTAPQHPATQATIGIALSQEQFPTPQLVELGVAAEGAGFGALWASDHFHPWQDNQGHAGLAWVTLAALSQRTRRVLLGTGVTCPTYRYRPAIVAEAFASLGLLAPGRVFLGVGTGEALNEVPAGGGWGPYQERAERLVEAVKIIRQLWSGQWVDFNGQYYQIKHARLYDVPQPTVPLYIAAAGEHSMRLAGEHGDGLICDNKSITQQKLRVAFLEGARTASKNADTLPILVEQYVVVGDRAEAERWAPLWRFLPGNKTFLQDPDPVSIQRRAAQEVPLEQVYGSWIVGSDAQTHIDGLQKLLDAGARMIFVHSPQPEQQRVIEFYGREVLPHLHLQQGMLSGAR